MDRSRSYYDLFGVGRNASALQIRAAYLRLLKAHHPDVSPDRDAGDFIRLINSAYNALNDPTRRACYDNELARPSAKQTSGSRFAPRRPTPTWRIWAPIFIVALAGAIAVMSMPRSASHNPDLFQDGLGWFTPIASNTNNHTAPLPRPAAIAEHARAGSRARAAFAVAHSERCFSEAREKQSLSQADLCIVFDDAFLYARNMLEADTTLPPRFNAMIVKLRHSSALAEVGAPETRLHRLWEATFAALMAELGTVVPTPDPKPATPMASATDATAASPLETRPSKLPQPGTVGERNPR